MVELSTRLIVVISLFLEYYYVDCVEYPYNALRPWCIETPVTKCAADVGFRLHASLLVLLTRFHEKKLDDNDI